jgi:hypothetical protein
MIVGKKCVGCDKEFAYLNRLFDLCPLCYRRSFEELKKEGMNIFAQTSSYTLS